ncbi:MAG: septum formation initiator family protein [Microthrixaceae bacterium]
MSLRDRLPVVPRWGRRILWLGALAAVVAAILTPAVSQWWSQRAEIRAGEDELALLEADNDQLRDRLDKIGDPATLERIARRDLGLVREGESPTRSCRRPPPVWCCPIRGPSTVWHRPWSEPGTPLVTAPDSYCP